MTIASWIIVDRATGKAIHETWSPTVVANVRRRNVADVVPIGEWLARVNAKAKQQ